MFCHENVVLKQNVKQQTPAMILPARIRGVSRIVNRYKCYLINWIYLGYNVSEDKNV